MKKQPLFEPRCILGLGNPGVSYMNTYHNVGAQAINDLIKKMGLDATLPRKEARYAYWKKNGIIIAKGTTFMNESGLAAREMLRKFKISPAHLLVVHDDSDLALGTARYAFGRGAAGHHGVLSVMNELGTKDFWRLRIGIRTTKEKAERFVLKKISRGNAAALYGVFEEFTRKVSEKERP